jgi:flagellar hook assembly protein FlgD
VSAPEAEDQTISITQMGLVTAADPMASSIGFNCYPNPFTSQLAIEIENPSLKEITVEIYSIDGQKIKTLAKALKGQKISLVWKGDDELGRQVPPGMYLVKMDGKTRKVIKD